jgi:hypothetical protein
MMWSTLTVGPHACVDGSTHQRTPLLADSEDCQQRPAVGLRLVVLGQDRLIRSGVAISEESLDFHAMKLLTRSMTVRDLADCLGDMLGEQFVTRHLRSDGILFRGPDPKRRGRLLGLRIMFKAWEHYEAKLPEAVARAIELLREHGGYVVIREDQAGELVIARELVLSA